MNDRRQLLLDQLAALLHGIGLGTVYRNRGEMSNALRPFLSLCDGTETITRTPANGARQSIPLLIELTPEITYYPALQLAPDNTLSEVVGLARITILSAILLDMELRGIVGPNGRILVATIETDLSIGKRMTGELTIRPIFVYPLLLSDLTP